MLKIFSKRTLSLVLSVFMLMTLVPMVSAEDAVTKTDYEKLVAGATEFAFEDMSGTVNGKEPVHAHSCLGKSPDSVCSYPNCSASSLTNSNQAGLRNQGSIGGFTANSETETIEATRGTTEVAVEAEPGNETNYALKMTGQGTGSDGTFSAVDFRTLSAKAVNSENRYGIQIWETKVKLPESTTGQLRLFAYDYAWGASVGSTQISTQVHVENGSVYRIDPAYDYDANYSGRYFEYNDCIATGLEAGEWYTFVRLIDLRDVTEHLDRVFVFDAEGNMLNATVPEWRIAGEITNKAYQTAGNLGIGHEAKNFAQGEDVYFDDIRIWHLSLPTISFAGDRIEGTNKYGLLTANGSSISKYAGILTSKTYMARESGESKRATYLQYKMDINLGSVESGSAANLFSQRYGGWGFSSTNPLVKIVGGAVQVMTGTTSGTATAVTNNGAPFVLAANKWYTFDYVIKMDTSATPSNHGDFTLTITDKATNDVVTATGNAVYALPAARVSQAGGNFMCGGSGFSMPIKLDNMTIGEYDDLACTTLTHAYGYHAANFENAEFDTWAIIPLTDSNRRTSASLAQLAEFYVAGDGDFIPAGVVRPEEITPVNVSLSAPVAEFTANNVVVTCGAEVVNNYTFTPVDSQNAKITFTSTQPGATYTITTTGFELASTLVPVPDASVSFEIWQDLKVSNFGICDANGGAVAQLPASGAIKATVMLNNEAAIPRTYALIIALYNDEEGLVDVAVLADTLDAGESTSDPLYTEPLDVTGATYAKAMLWDGFQTLVPLTGDVVISPAAAQ